MRYFGLFIATLLSLPASAKADPELGDRAECAKYARTALEQYVQIKTIENCYKGDNGRWHTNYQLHYNWCMSASPAAVATETRLRSAGIERCMRDAGEYNSQ